MKRGIVIADSGAIFSLALLGKLSLLDELFDDVKITVAMWNEITKDEKSSSFKLIYEYFKNKINNITSFSSLSIIMDIGEAESVIFYKEINADFLLIDDKKARQVAESLGVKCIGTLGALSVAKRENLITELRPLFQILYVNKRYFSLHLLNQILSHYGEKALT